MELNKEPQEDPENPTPQPTSHTESHYSRVSLVPSHWTEDAAPEPTSGRCFQQSTHWAPAVVYVGWGWVGRMMQMLGLCFGFVVPSPLHPQLETKFS